MMMYVVKSALIFPAIYAYALYDRVPGSPAIKGTAWGGSGSMDPQEQ